MKVLELIFKLLLQFIQFEDGRYEDLKRKADYWYIEEQKKENSKWKKWIDLNEQWYVQVGLAVLFMWLVKAIRNWLLAEPEADVDDDDENEEMNAAMQAALMKKAGRQFFPNKF